MLRQVSSVLELVVLSPGPAPPLVKTVAEVLGLVPTAPRCKLVRCPPLVKHLRNCSVFWVMVLFERSVRLVLELRVHIKASEVDVIALLGLVHNGVSSHLIVAMSARQNWWTMSPDCRTSIDYYRECCRLEGGLPWWRPCLLMGSKFDYGGCCVGNLKWMIGDELVRLIWETIK